MIVIGLKKNKQGSFFPHNRIFGSAFYSTGTAVETKLGVCGLALGALWETII